MLKEKLRNLTKKLLGFDNKIEGEQIGEALFLLLSTSLSLDKEERSVIPTAGKGALSAYDSAYCIAYSVRNQAILKATLKAIHANKNPNILYIGPGAFAPFFIFPLLLGYKAKFTLLEINPYAIKVMRELIQKLGFEEEVLTIIEADAITWESDLDYEIVLCETTDVGLQREDTLPIFKNLKRQLPNAIYVPKDVELFVGSKKLNALKLFDTLNQAIKRGYLRTDYPYSVEQQLYIQNRVIMAEGVALEPETSVITTKLFIRN